jgi:hypothetical protein
MGPVRWSIASLLALAAASAAAVPAGACACGVALESEVRRERALVIERPGGEEIIASFDLARDGDRPAVLLPVPGNPRVTGYRGSDPLAYLDAATAPRAEPSAGPARTVGGYDVGLLRPGDPRALARWLDRNDYELPGGAQPILDSYFRRNWRFVTIRLAEGSEGRLKPLRIGFATRELVYPMRLSSLGERPIELTLFVAARTERRASPLRVGWSGPANRLDPRPPKELRLALGRARHLTRLEANGTPPPGFKADLRLGPVAKAAVSDTHVDEEEGWSWVLLPGAAILIAALMLLGARRLRG